MSEDSGVNGLPACGGGEAFEPVTGPAIQTPQQVHLIVIEDGLAEVLRFLLHACERPSPVRRDLLSIAAQVQALQAKALLEARRR